MEKSWTFSRLFVKTKNKTKFFCQDQNSGSQDQDFSVFGLEAPRDQDFGLEDNITVITKKIWANAHGCVGFWCAWYCLNQLARIQKMMHKRGPRAVLGLEQGLTF